MAKESKRRGDSGRWGNRKTHPEMWRVHGNEAQMIDTSAGGPLGPARDDDGVNSCKPRSPWPDAPGFERADDCGEGSLSGASDGAAGAARGR